MANQVITADMLIDTIVTDYPETTRVFLRHRLLCVGCPISRHHMVTDCAEENSLDVGALVDELNEAIRKASKIQ